MELKWHELVTAQYVLVTALVALVAAWLVKHLMTSPKNLPPGPSGLPLLGVFTKFIGISGDPLPLLSEWADRYGEITSFYFGPQLVVSLNSYGAVAEAFRHPNLQGRPRSRMLEEISGFGPNAGLLIGVGDIWKEQRKFTFSVFRSLGVGKRSYEDTVAAEMTQLARAIEEKEGSPFDPSDLLSRAVSNVICTIIFGTQYKYDDAEFKELLHILNTNMRLGGSGGWIFFLPIPGLSKIPFGAINTMMVNARRFYAFIDAHIYAHRKHGIPEIPRDFIDQYLIKLEEIEGTESSFNQKSLKSVISDLFFAGTETTLTTLKWCILYMIAYPEIQSRVQSEIDTVIGRDRLPGLSDRKDLPYTCAVLTEVQRKAAVVSLGVPHMAEADVTIKDFTIPKGTIVLSNLWKVLNSNAFWEEADDFKPERFLDENGKLTKREDLIFFSTGRRICLGEQLARMETFLGFTSLLHRFTFKQPDNATAPSFEGVLGGTRVSLPYVTCAIPRN